MLTASTSGQTPITKAHESALLNFNSFGTASNACARGGPARTHCNVQCRASIAEKVKGELTGKPLESWSTCVDRIRQLGFEDDGAETVVGQAFGWGKQSYWLNKKSNEVPNLEKVNAVLSYLEGDLSIKGDDLQKVVKSFPEVLNCDVERRLKHNMQHMQKAYFMKEPAAINTVKRRPEVLGYTLDCEGSCEGLCTQCWVRL